MAGSVIDVVQRRQPLTTILPQCVYPLAPEAIRPVIRIAHRSGMRGVIGPRVIVDHELVYVRSGRGVFRTSEGATSFHDRSCLLVQPFVPHVFEPQGAVDHVAIHFDVSLQLPPRGANLARRRPYAVKPVGTATWPRVWAWPREHPHAQGLERIVDEFVRGDPWALASAQARLALLLLELLQQPGQIGGRQAAHAARIDRAVVWLDDNLHRDVGGEDMAAIAGLSLTHFRRVFRDWSGMSLSDFIQHARIAKARQWLHDERLSIKEIAARAGFADPFHFSRVFRRIDGLSPTQFREAALAGRVRT
jgi:AraC-like DNA-binding protein